VAGNWVSAGNAPSTISTYTQAVPEVVTPGEEAPPQAPLDAIASHLRRSFATPGESLFDDLESLIVTEAYQRCGGNQVQTALLLGITRNVLRTLLKRHGLLQDTSVPYRDAPPEDLGWSMDAARV
jgi:DNA-binding NtrC family response regulator